MGLAAQYGRTYRTRGAGGMMSRMASMGEAGAAVQKFGYRPALDGVRGVAVALVVLAHLEVPGFRHGGFVGVTLFFVLSGYLITRLLVEEQRIDLPGFYRRRVRRLLPALGVLVAVCVPLLTLSQVAWVAMYAGNWQRAAGGELGPLSHTWSLAIEEQFYLVWPLVLLFARRHAVRVAVVGISVAVILRPLLWSDAGDTALVYFSTFTRIDAVLAGALLALTGWRLRGGAVALAALVVLCAVGSEQFMFDTGLTVVTALAVVAVAASVTSPSSMFAHPVLRYLGRRSYGLYLWHFPLILWLDWHPLALIAASTGVAEASWRLVESRWISPSPPPATASTTPRPDPLPTRQRSYPPLTPR